ncbi:MAG: metallophosphoesterase [Candidatus Cloacimonadota bacterium]|nr:metallophosphoesterase [Candidatus Cloacimonadota bacterium]
MRKFITIFFMISFTILFSISIYDIQYTTDPGPDGTYPSPYEGQIVTTGGLVFAVDFNNGRFFITEGGDDWEGIYVYDNDQDVAVGDSVIIQAEVYEYWGFTELSNIVSCEIISSGNAIPAIIPTYLTQVEQESNESVKVWVQNIEVSQSYDEWGQWEISNSSSECIISTGFINMQEMGIPIVVGYPLWISGFVTYFWEEFQLNPVSINSIHSASEDHIISISEQQVFSPEEFEIPIYHTVFNDGQVQSYQFEMEYNDQIMEYTGYEVDGTLSANGTIEVEQVGNGIISVSYNGNFSFENMETLLKLNFIGLESGSGDLEFLEFLINNVSVEYFSVENIVLQMETIPIGDTLTVIQKPLLNIPAIVVPNEDLQIECVADAAVTGWDASLWHDNKTIDLDILSSVYNNELERWQLSAQIPTPDIYEMYDLIVSGNGIETDTTENAVSIIPELKDEYYFVHITDSHLPTHIFYPDPLSLSDTTEVNDLREVINDINLINPEFVLISGDFINEGEMEDFENRRVYTKAQKMLTEFEVPIFLVTGNHDVGGWVSSPPSQGTARRNWWRFFGWDWLSDPPASQPCYTQNYSFDYGPIHFIGMDAYINYDNYMPEVFGGESFTDLQMEWLEDDLAQNSGSDAFVLFYHYDFSDQINLENLGVDMTLWGHIHSNSGSIYNYPYNLATAATCDGERAYRVIYVDNAELQPTATVYAGWDGEELQAEFTPANNGIADSVYCNIQNSHNLDFSDAQLKFIMPINAEEYQVYNGDLLQIDETGEFAVCYVAFEIPANGNISVSVIADFDAAAENPIVPTSLKLSNYPNPFNPETTISFSVIQTPSFVTLEIYNLKGQKVKDLSPSLCHPKSVEGRGEAQYTATWDGTDDNGIEVSSGIYFIKLKCEDLISSKKIMLLK